MILLLACRVATTTPAPADATPQPPYRRQREATWVGAQTCAACHPTAASTWLASGHAHAMEPLVERERSHDPTCFRCHVTAFGYAGGFPAPHLDSVGCEACHGPGSIHVATPGGGYGALPRGEAGCLPCHTWENSPDFTWEAYWPRIAHGRE